MPPRAGHLPNVVERVALQELKTGDLPAQRIGSHTVIANLLGRDAFRLLSHRLHGLSRKVESRATGGFLRATTKPGIGVYDGVW
jgi:hypothetical protein